jgi:hypothetical protein
MTQYILYYLIEGEQREYKAIFETSYDSYLFERALKNDTNVKISFRYEEIKVNK